MKISSTAEIEIFSQNSPQYKICKVYEKMLIKDMPSLSRDIITRIVAAKEVINSEISLETINEWRKEAINAEQNRRVKKAYIAFANSVKTFYENHGVKWTKCKPNNIREIEKKIDLLNTPITIQGEPTGDTIAGLITGNEGMKISFEDAKRLLDSDDPPFKETKRK